MPYLGAEQSLNWLFLFFLFSVLQWILIGLYVHKYSNNFFADIKGFQVSEKIPFIKDNFFLFWNIFPIILYLFFVYLDYSWKTLIQHLLMIDNKNGDILKYYNYLFGDNTILYADTVSVLVMVALAFYAFYIQIEKQKGFIKDKNKIYWWDIRIVEKIFWIREIFLFTNIIMIGYISFILFKTALFVTLVLHIDNLNVTPFHPDGYGGLRVLMEISSVVLALYLLRSVMGIIGFNDHKEQGFGQKVGDYYNMVYLPAGVIFIIYQIIKTKEYLQKAYINYNIDSILSANNYNKLLSELNIDMNSTALSNFFDKIDNYYHIFDFNKFPIDLNLYTSSIFTFILPLSLWFFLNHFKERVATSDNTPSSSKEKKPALYDILFSDSNGKNLEKFGNFIVVVIIILVTTFFSIGYLYIITQVIDVTPYEFYKLKISLTQLPYIFYIVMFLFPFFILGGKINQRVWFFITTIVLFFLPYYTFWINNLKIDFDIANSWSFGFIILNIIVAILLNFGNIKEIKFNKKELWIIFITSIGLILFMQISTYIMMNVYGIANEDRSLFLYKNIYKFNMEIHHINYGIIGVILIPVMAKVFSGVLHNKYIRYIFFIICGIFYGMIWDEWFYYMYADVSDKAYMSSSTYILAVMGVVISYISWTVFIKIFYKNKKEMVLNA